MMRGGRRNVKFKYKNGKWQSKIQNKKKQKILRKAEFFVVDLAGLAPASLGANTNLLLYTARARIHALIIKQKEPLLQGIPSV